MDTGVHHVMAYLMVEYVVPGDQNQSPSQKLHKGLRLLWKCEIKVSQGIFEKHD